MCVFKYHAFIFSIRPPRWQSETLSTYVKLKKKDILSNICSRKKASTGTQETRWLIGLSKIQANLVLGSRTQQWAGPFWAINKHLEIDIVHCGHLARFNRKIRDHFCIASTRKCVGLVFCENYSGQRHAQGIAEFSSNLNLGLNNFTNGNIRCVRNHTIMMIWTQRCVR